MGDDWKPYGGSRIKEFQKLVCSLVDNFNKKEISSRELENLNSKKVNISQRALAIENIAKSANYQVFGTYHADMETFNPKIILIGFINKEYDNLKKAFATMCRTPLVDDSEKDVEKIILNMESKGVIAPEKTILRFEGIEILYRLFAGKRYESEFDVSFAREQEKKAKEAEEQARKNCSSDFCSYLLHIDHNLRGYYEDLRKRINYTIVPHITDKAVKDKNVVWIAPLQNIETMHSGLLYDKRNAKSNIQNMSLIPFKIARYKQ